MYNRIVIVLCMPAIDDLTKFWVMDVNSVETAWKKTEIWSEETSSGNFVGNSDTKLRKLLNRPGMSKIKAWSWIYRIGTSQIKIAAPVIINIEKVIKSAKYLLIL